MKRHIAKNPGDVRGRRERRSSFLLRLAMILLLALWVLPLRAQPNPPAKTLEQLQDRLVEHLAQPRFGAGMFGVKIVSLKSGKTLFEHNAGTLFSPASNCKLFTVALALDQLGGDYRLKTSLYAAKPDRLGTVKGDLVVFGRGDPGFNARLHSNDIFQALEPLVAVLTKAGVRRISGDLVGDESFFRGPPYGSGWDADDLQFFYGAEISALTINDNILTLTAQPGDRVGTRCTLLLAPATGFVTLSNRTVTVVSDGKQDIQYYRPLGENLIYVTGQWPLGKTNHSDYVTVHNPAGLFIAFFKEALARHGIKVGGRLHTMNWLDRQIAPLDLKNVVELGAVESAPVRDLARAINQPSQNLYADLLLAHLGARALATNAASGKTSEASGIEQLNLFLKKIGIGTNDVHFEEGSGLSRNNLATPGATVALLAYMSRHAEAAAYRDSLPVAGVDGSLKNRMLNTPAAGNVRAKTGTLRWVDALSGYVTTAAGEPLAFSIMVNRLDAPARDAVDAIAVQLAEFAGRSDR